MLSYCSKQKVKKKELLVITLVVAVGVSASGAGQPHACSSLIISVLRSVWRLRVSIRSWFWRRQATYLLLQLAPSQGRTPFSFKRKKGVGCRLRSAGNELITDTLNDGGWVDGEVIVYNRFAGKAVCTLIPLHTGMS